jgi:ferrous iron transport protein A
MPPSPTITLDQARKGDRLLIQAIPDATVRVQVVRFGLAIGATVTCQSVMPGGPVILRRGFQEIAIGRDLARTIQVERQAS